jgi:hypothetical protein
MMRESALPDGHLAEGDLADFQDFGFAYLRSAMPNSHSKS